MIKNLILFCALGFLSSVYAVEKINGAGATFPYPIYSKWFSEYQKTNKEVEFNYQSIGSGGGIKQLLAQTVDFGASDAPMTDEELSKAKFKVNHIPTVLGSIAIAYNVKGLENNLKLDGPTLSKIFLGEINKWNASEIAALNPGLKLPNEDILVVRRSDGSGTTAVYTDYLAKVSPAWNSKVGAGKNVKWPAGIGAKGNEGVTAIVAQTAGAIGYIELAYAINSKLNVAAIKNAQNEFVVPNVNSTSKAGSDLKNFKDDMRFSVVNANVAGAYPISSYTYILLPEGSTTKANIETKKFLRWALSDGQKYTSELHYAPLPPKMVEALQKFLK